MVLIKSGINCSECVNYAKYAHDTLNHPEKKLFYENMYLHKHL